VLKKKYIGKEEKDDFVRSGNKGGSQSSEEEKRTKVPTFERRKSDWAEHPKKGEKPE